MLLIFWDVVGYKYVKKVLVIIMKRIFFLGWDGLNENKIEKYFLVIGINVS